MNNIEEQKSAEQVVIENKLNRITEGTSDIKKYVEKEEKIRKLTTVYKKNNILCIVPAVVALLGILSMLLPVFISKSSMSVWKFIFDYGIPQERVDGFDLNNLDFSVYGNAFYEFVYGEQVSKLLSKVRGIEILVFCMFSAYILIKTLIHSVGIFILNSNAETRIRQNYDSAVSRNSFRSVANGKGTPKSMIRVRQVDWAADVIPYPIVFIFPVSFGIFLEEWFQGFMHVNAFYYVLPALCFIGSIIACWYANKYNKENKQDLIEATATYNAKF
ncbi:MAG: hypothetical protein IJQ07_03975 [Clostridia bacterium]|nr:hypothetical protein [Clostridia bacterium]